jgi:hypothetical protein
MRTIGPLGNFLAPRKALLAGVAIAAALVMACGSGGGDSSSDTGGAAVLQPGQPTLNVAVASYDLVADRDNRFIAGLLTFDNDFVSYGTVQMRFFYLGNGQQEQEPRFFKEETATFLQIPGEGEPNPPGVPTVGAASQGRGVYAVEPIKFDQAGYWQVEVTAKTKDGELAGASAFGVDATNSIPAPGDEALATDSLTVASDALASSIDSRATTVDDIPDAALHQLSIAQALQQAKPLVIVFSTPVFCVSQFCGPVTEMVADLQKQYGDKANFVHIEIWSDFQKGQINQAARDWLFRNDNLNEPWVFLIDKDGTIVNRWDNVATQDEVQTALDALLTQ